MQQFLALFSILMLALNPIQAARQNPPVPTRPLAKYTIMVYMNGSDLETNGQAATRDLAEMLKAGSTDQVNVLVETLGTAKWTPPFIASDRNQRWRVGPGKLELVDDTVGLRPLADPNTLRDFIIWSMRNYPAEKYAIIFWNHGGGALFGYGNDEANPANPSIGLAGIRQGIADALRATGGTFELIGFDTCLLATAELAAALSPYGRYLVASEELEPGHGWNYTPALQAVHADPSITGDRLGQVIAEQYRAQAQEQRTDNAITLSVVDLGKMQGVVDAWQQFLSAMAPAVEQEDGLRTLQKARDTAESYGGAADMVDLHDLVSKAAALAPEQSELVARRIREAVVYNINSVGNPRASGLSIYFPHRGKDRVDLRLAIYGRAGFSGAYQDFLSNYAAVALSDTEPVQFASAEPNKAPAGDRSTRFSLQVNPEQVDEVAGIYAILAIVNPEEPDDFILLSYDSSVDFDPETGELADTFDQAVVTLNGHYVAMYLEHEGETYDRYAIPIELNGVPVTLLVLYDYTTDQDIILGAWPGIDSESQMAQKELIRIRTGDQITPLFEFYNDTTGETGHYVGETFTVQGKLRLGYTEVPEGTYLYGFQVVDYAGNESYSDFVEVEVIYEEGYEPAGEYWEPEDEEYVPEPEPELEWDHEEEP